MMLLRENADKADERKRRLFAEDNPGEETEPSKGTMDAFVTKHKAHSQTTANRFWKEQLKEKVYVSIC
jgi:hypothetical protein